MLSLYLPELFQSTSSLSETDTKHKIEEVLFLLSEVVHQGYIPARLQEISEMPEYLSWIDCKNNTVFHHIALLTEKSWPKAKNSLLHVTEKILKSISQETRDALLQNKNNDRKTPFEIARSMNLCHLVDKFRIYSTLDMKECGDEIEEEINNYLKQSGNLTEEEEDKNVYNCVTWLDSWEGEKREGTLGQLDQIAIEHDYSKSDVVDDNNNTLPNNSSAVVIKSNPPSSEIYNLRVRTGSAYNRNCSCCNSR